MNIIQKLFINDWEIVHTFSHDFSSSKHDLESTAYAVIKYSPSEDVYDYTITGTLFNGDYNLMQYKCQSEIMKLQQKNKTKKIEAK